MYKTVLRVKFNKLFYALSGIQQTVKALEYTLKNLLVYRDYKANLDCLQRPYKEQPKRVRNFLF